MKVLYGLGQARKNFKNCVLAIGVFDGLHVGHQELIRTMIRRARTSGSQAIVLTFSSHPVHVLHPEIPLSLIVSFDYRLKLIEDLGVDGCFVVRFTKKFAHLSPDKFIRNYLIDGLKAQAVFVGDDFRFGQNRTGTIEIFKELGRRWELEVHGVHPVLGNRHKVSSTDIRSLIVQGKLDEAKKYLGRNVSIMGTVRQGDLRGRALGFPTANIYPTHEVIPPLGVYAVKVVIGKKKYHGMTNIGRRPSFPSRNELINIETHIFNFKKNIYGQKIIVEFINRIRDEKAFLSKEKLVAQLEKDEQKVRSFFKQRSS